jgi:hypothetical protein
MKDCLSTSCLCAASTIPSSPLALCTTLAIVCIVSKKRALNETRAKAAKAEALKFLLGSGQEQ